MGNPTDPDAGTNRNNAMSRDNLMNGASLGYSGHYTGTTLNYVGERGLWWLSTIHNNSSYSYFLLINTSGSIHSEGGSGYKYLGRSVRCLLSPLVALVQDLIHCRMYILAAITGVRVGFTTRRCLATTGRLV